MDEYAVVGGNSPDARPIDILRYNPHVAELNLLSMLKTFWATINQGKVQLLEQAEIPEGTRVLVTLLPDDEAEFWLQTSQVSLDTVWDNAEDDVYAQLLEK